MRVEMKLRGHKIHIIIVNKDDAIAEQGELTKRCSIPIFQDLVKVGAWAQHSGNKDDMFIYDKNGKLAVYLPALGPTSTDLSTKEGYENLKKAILSVK